PLSRLGTLSRHSASKTRVNALKASRCAAPGHAIGFRTGTFFRLQNAFFTRLQFEAMLEAFPASLIEGAFSRANLNAERGVASCGGGSYRLASGAPGPGPPGITTWVRGARCNRSGANAGERSAAPSPKTATVERREASVPRYGTQGASLGAWHAAS